MNKVRSATPKSSTVRASRIRIGFVALTDCAPLMVADALGLFVKQGVEVELSREVGWATIREKILYRQLDAAHAIAGLALSLRLGLDGMVCPTIAPFVFNLHGNAITLSMNLWRCGVRDAATLRKLIRSTSQQLYTFGIAARTSSHNFLLRRWLKSGGIDPDTEVRLVVLPPTQMAGSLSAGLIDGFCVGEPWNSVAVAHGIGWCPVTSEDLMPGHPEKILLTTEDFAGGNHDELMAIIRALQEACHFCDQKANRSRVADIIISSGQLRVDKEVLKTSLLGPFDDGTQEPRNADRFHVFHRGEANVPSREKGAWLLQEFLDHGLVSSPVQPETRQAAYDCWRPDLYHQASEVKKSPASKTKARKTATSRKLVRA